jgi:hypothetical protein
MQKRSVRLEHGAALRVPQAMDEASWSVLLGWLGAAGSRLDSETLIVETGGRDMVAKPGDWIVLAADGVYHVGRSSAVIVPMPAKPQTPAVLN